MITPFTQDFKKGFWAALYEYLIVTMPVAIYVFLEASDEKGWNYLYCSPEWAIATIFLSFISLSHYLTSVGKSGKQVFEPIIGIISIIILLIIIASTLNAKISIDLDPGKDSDPAIFCRIILFIIATIIFFIFMTGAKLIKKT